MSTLVVGLSRPEASAQHAPPDALSERLLSAATNGRIGELRKSVGSASDGTVRLAALYPFQARRAGEADDVTPVTRMTLLGAAAAEGQEGAIDALLELGAVLDQPALDGRVPLMFAAGHADVGLVKQLLGRGANPLLVDDAGRDAAEHAHEMGRLRPNDPTWERTVRECVEMIDEAAQSWRRARARRRWRVSTWVVVLLREWQSRAAERAYAPGGTGFAAVSEEFRDLAGAPPAPAVAVAPASSVPSPPPPIADEDAMDDLWARIQQQNAEVVVERKRCTAASSEEAMKHETMKEAARQAEAALGLPTGLSHLRLAGQENLDEENEQERAPAAETLEGLAASERAWKPKDGSKGYCQPAPRNIT